MVGIYLVMMVFLMIWKIKKTIAFKQLGNNFAEIMLNIKTMSFELIKNGNDSSQIKCDRFSTCLKMADEWFKLLEE